MLGDCHVALALSRARTAPSRAAEGGRRSPPSWNVCLCLAVWLSVCVSVSGCLSVWLSVCLAVCLSGCLLSVVRPSSVRLASHSHSHSHSHSQSQSLHSSAALRAECLLLLLLTCSAATLCKIARGRNMCLLRLGSAAPNVTSPGCGGAAEMRRTTGREHERRENEGRRRSSGSPV